MLVTLLAAGGDLFPREQPTPLAYGVVSLNLIDEIKGDDRAPA